MSVSFISACRACGHTELTPAFTLAGDNAWAFCGDASGHQGCGLLQRATDEPARRYQLPEQLSWTEQFRIRGIVSAALEMISTRDGRALDIGCGHGTLLNAYPRWMTPVGVDPRLRASGAQDWGVGLSSNFTDEESYKTLRELSGGGFDVITAIGSLERAKNPSAFFEQMKGLLSPDGIIIIETTYAALALTRTLASAFHRDANAVFSLESLYQLATSADLHIVRGQMTESNGGSIRLFMTHADYRGQDYAPWLDVLARLWDEEAALSLRGRAAYAAFQMRLTARTLEIGALQNAMLRAQEHAYVIGTGPRVMSTLRTSELEYDVISAHIGDAYRGGYPEVITEEMARTTPPDMLIAPTWRRRETLEAWHDQVMDGMRIAFLEPELLIVDDENYASELGRALAITDGPGSVETLQAALSAMRGPGLRVVPKSVEA